MVLQMLLGCSSLANIVIGEECLDIQYNSCKVKLLQLCPVGIRMQFIDEADSHPVEYRFIFVNVTDRAVCLDQKNWPLWFQFSGPRR